MRNLLAVSLTIFLIIGCKNKLDQDPAPQQSAETISIIAQWNNFKEKFTANTKKTLRNEMHNKKKLSLEECMEIVEEGFAADEKPENKISNRAYVNLVYPTYGCDSAIFVEIINKNKQLLMNKFFVNTIAYKEGVIAKFCDEIPSFSPSENKEIFDSVLYSGDENDFLCIYGKYHERPEINIRLFAAEHFSGKKENFILMGVTPELFKDRNAVLTIFSHIADKDINRIRNFIEIARITKNELGYEWFLSMAMQRNDTAVLDLLFENGFSPHYVTNSTRETILDFAIGQCNPIAIDYLLEKGAALNYRIKDSELPISKILDYGCPSVQIDDDFNPAEIITSYLIIKGLSVKGKGGDILPMGRMVRGASLKMLKFIEKHGYDFSYASNADSYLNPLTESLSNKDAQVFDWLISAHGFDVNSPDKDGDTPLHEMVRRRNKEKVEFLLKKGADLNIKNKEGKIPFQIAKEILSEEIQRDKRRQEYIKDRYKSIKMKKPLKGDCDRETAGDYESDRIKEAHEMIELLEKK